jgi:hypothetical protein
MIQQGVSDAGRVEGAPHSNGNGMDVGRVMDWVDARLAAIRAREEEEDEDEERERSRAPRPAAATASSSSVLPTPTASTSVAPSAVPPVVSATEQRPLTHPTTPPLPTGPSPAVVTTVLTPTPAPASPPSSPIVSPPSMQRLVQPFPANRARNARPIAGPSSSPPSVSFPSAPPESMSDAVDVGTGAKRRHAVMMMLDAAGAPTVEVPGASGASVLGRRRTRSSRALPTGVPLTRDSEDMDIDDGRERKRVARR